MAMSCGKADPLPTYFELINGIINFTAHTIRFNYIEDRELLPIEKSWHYVNYENSDIVVVLILGAVFTVLRYLCTEWIFKPLAEHYSLTPANQKKMPESAWKLIYYICAWSYCLYVVILSGNYCFFQKPSTVFDGWSLENPVPMDVYIMYVTQSGFYAHSLYATLFLDIWRRDSVVMMVHHVLTLALLFISYSLRYHNIGILVLFFHDICDVQLEFTKLNVYFKTQHGKFMKQHEILANITFFGFVVTWFVSRLYWYPLKVLYGATSDVAAKNYILPCAILMNVLLWLLQAMNIYWFMFILGFLYKVATGQVREVDDTRDYDVEEKFSRRLLTNLENVSGTIDDDSVAVKNGVPEKLTNGECSPQAKKKK